MLKILLVILAALYPTRIAGNEMDYMIRFKPERKITDRPLTAAALTASGAGTFRVVLEIAGAHMSAQPASRSCTCGIITEITRTLHAAFTAGPGMSQRIAMPPFADTLLRNRCLFCHIAYDTHMSGLSL
jgi:hypothetical protein